MKKCIFIFILILTLIFSNLTVAFAESDQAVTIVNPVSCSSVTSSNLLISVKITQPKEIQVSVSEVKKSVEENSVSLGENDMKAIIEGNYEESASLTYSAITTCESFTSTNNLSFYIKNLDVSPGVYLIKVDTIFQDKVIYSSQSYVTIKSKDSEAESNLFDSSQSGTAAFLQNLLKSIFGN